MRDCLHLFRQLPSLVGFWRSLAVAAALLGSTSWAYGQESIATLKDSLKSSDEKVRIQTMDALGRMGAGAESAVSDLAAELDDKSPRIRAHAERALQAIGAKARETAPRLAQMVNDPDPHVRRLAIDALQAVRPEPSLAVGVLAKALGDENLAVRIAALNALTNYGEASGGALADALKDPKTRYWAELAIGELHLESKPAIESLAKALADDLKDEKPEVRREALISLAKLGPNCAGQQEAIAASLADPDPSVRVAAAFALGHFAAAAAPSLPALRKAMVEGGEMLPTVCAWAIARVEPNDKQARGTAVDMLTKALDNKNPRVRMIALRGIADLVPEPARLVPLLTKAIDEGDPALTAESLALAAPLGEDSLPVLIAGLKRAEGRGRAALLVAQLGAKGGPAAQALAGALSDKDIEVRREVLLALAALGTAAGPAQSAIVKALQDPEPRIRAIAAYTLGRLGPSAAAAVPALRAELESPDPVVRVASAYALVHILPSDPQIAAAALPVLMQGLKNENVNVRRGSAEALGVLGKAGRSAIPALQAATRDSDDSVAKAALAALERVGGAIISPDERRTQAIELAGASDWPFAIESPDF